MKKRFTKIICFAVAAISAIGISATAGCGKYYKGNNLSGNYSAGTVDPKDNGGFAVKKGEYIYFINGVEGYTADNDYGTPVKGGIYRISADNLAARNYASVDCVVPNVIYSGNSNAGIFVYGDYIYYSTPSTEKDANGTVLNTVLDLKSTKLNGNDTMKEPYLRLTNNSDEFRYVQDGDKIYILYVATSEKLYDESTGVTNLHSYDIATGKDTVLAYNVDKVLFDSEEKGNPRVYYTMKVRDYVSDSDYSYNQIYTVTASATEDKFAKKLSSDTVLGWDDDTDRYINCGDLVFDGRGKTDVKTLFNADYDGEIGRSGFTYTLASYNNGTVFYTRTTPNNSSPYLFALKDTAAYDPVDGNPDSDKRILSYADSSSVLADSYTYLYKDNGDLNAVILAGSDGITINYATYTGNDYKLQTTKSDNENKSTDYFNLVGSDAGSATVLFIDGDYLYYSVESGIYRINYTGDMSSYGANVLATGDSYEPVQILDIKSQSSWYAPEFIDGQILFASATAQMSAYSYIMACDIDGLTDKQIEELNDLYNGIDELITETFSDEEKYPTENYANLPTALQYAFYTGESSAVYLKGLADRLNSKLDEDSNLVYSEKTLELYEQFLNPAESTEWKDYADKSVKVNGETVYANRLDYYYSVVGKMSAEDAEAYTEGLRSAFLIVEGDDTATWWQGLSTAAKVWFVIGMCALGLVVAGGIAVAVILIVRKKRKSNAGERRKRVKVDLTDDKDIDVYDNGEKPEAPNPADGN